MELDKEALWRQFVSNEPTREELINIVETEAIPYSIRNRARFMLLTVPTDKKYVQCRMGAVSDLFAEWDKRAVSKSWIIAQLCQSV